MFSELAISPSVFLGESYSHPDVCDAHLIGLKETLLHSTLIRDLRQGSYSNFVADQACIHQRGKELLKQLKKQRRLVSSASVLDVVPNSSSDWTKEALASHERDRLTGILTCAAIKSERNEALVADVAKRTSAPWWTEVSRRSWSPPRTNQEYLAILLPLFKFANSIRIIDPHFDPTKKGYRQIGDLFLPLKDRQDQPELEIHRVCYENSGHSRNILEEAEMKRRFSALSEFMAQHGLRATVFVWADGHDRHILSDLGGIISGNGMDTSGDTSALVTWARIDRETSDQITRRHDPNANSRLFQYCFHIGIQ